MVMKRVCLANWSLRTSPKFTAGVKYQFRKSQSPFDPIPGMLWIYVFLWGTLNSWCMRPQSKKKTTACKGHTAYFLYNRNQKHLSVCGKIFYIGHVSRPLIVTSNSFYENIDEVGSSLLRNLRFSTQFSFNISRRLKIGISDYWFSISK